MTDRYGITRLWGAYNELCKAIRSGNFDRAETALDRLEPWADCLFTRPASPKNHHGLNDWLDETEVFASRRERLIGDIGDRGLDWVEAAWNVSAQTSLQKAQETPQSVVVKPLEWLDAGFVHDADFVDATHTYQVQEGIYWYAASIDGVQCGTNEAAKAAAQADHQRRILSQITTEPVTVQDVRKRLVQRMNIYAGNGQTAKALGFEEAIEEFDAALRAIAGEGG